MHFKEHRFRPKIFQTSANSLIIDADKEESSNNIMKIRNRRKIVLDEYNSLGKNLAIDIEEKNQISENSSFYLKRKSRCSCIKRNCINSNCKCFKINIFCNNCSCVNCNNNFHAYDIPSSQDSFFLSEKLEIKKIKQVLEY